MNVALLRVLNSFLVHWEKSQENVSKIPPKKSIFFSKWANYLPILRKNGNFGNFPEIFP